MMKPISSAEQVAKFGFNVFGKKAVEFYPQTRKWGVKFTTVSRDVSYEYVTDSFVREAAASKKKIDRDGRGHIILK